MRGTPRSIWLSWANRAAGWWMGTAMAEVRRQQRVALKKITRPRGPKARSKRRTGSAP